MKTGRYINGLMNRGKILWNRLTHDRDELFFFYSNPINYS